MILVPNYTKTEKDNLLKIPSGGLNGVVVDSRPEGVVVGTERKNKNQ